MKDAIYKVLLSPHVSSKAYMVADHNSQIVFKVAPKSNKIQIKAAVEALFDVKVLGVSTTNVKGKQRRFGRITGRTKNWKKAYVTLAEGHDIDFTGPAVATISNDNESTKQMNIDK